MLPIVSLVGSTAFFVDHSIRCSLNTLLTTSVILCSVYARLIYCLLHCRSHPHLTIFTVKPTRIARTKVLQIFSLYAINFRKGPARHNPTGPFRCGPATSATTLTSAPRDTAQAASMRPATNAIQHIRRHHDDAFCRLENLSVANILTSSGILIFEIAAARTRNCLS